MAKTEVEYFHMGPWNLAVGFTTSVKAFKREMKKLGVKDIPQMTKAFSGSAAATHWLDRPTPVFIITLSANPEGYRYRQVASLLAHEAVHVARGFFKSIGERKVSAEAEAYFIQYVTQCCLGVFDQERGHDEILVSNRKSKKLENSEVGFEAEADVS